MIVNVAKVITILLMFLLILAAIQEEFYDEEWLFFILFMALGVINLFALAVKTEERKLSNIWPLIFFKRLAIQEKLKIEELEKKNETRK